MYSRQDVEALRRKLYEEFAPKETTHNPNRRENGTYLFWIMKANFVVQIMKMFHLERIEVLAILEAYRKGKSSGNEKLDMKCEEFFEGIYE